MVRRKATACTYVRVYQRHTQTRGRVCLLLPSMNFLGSSARTTNTCVYKIEYFYKYIKNTSQLSYYIQYFLQRKYNYKGQNPTITRHIKGVLNSPQRYLLNGKRQTDVVCLLFFRHLRGLGPKICPLSRGFFFGGGRADTVKYEQSKAEALWNKVNHKQPQCKKDSR